MTVHRLTITGEAMSLRRIWDDVCEQHAALVADDSLAVTGAGGVLEFNTTDLMMIMSTPRMVLTDVQVDAVQVSDAQRLDSPAPVVPAPRRAGSAALAASSRFTL